MIDEPKNNSVDIDKTSKVEIEKLIGGGKSLNKDKGKRNLFELMLITIL